MISVTRYQLDAKVRRIGRYSLVYHPISSKRRTMNKYLFRIIDVNLSNGRISKNLVSSEDLRKFVGGASLAAYLLYPYLTQELDPLSPDAPLLFITGLLTGTSGPAVGRFVICGKSPATKIWGESNIGGFFGPELRKSGVDGLLITGSSPSPVYLWIKNGKVEIRAADHLWGKTDTYQTQSILRDELDEPTVKICTIGMAGEERIPFASIMCDHGRVAGRTGMGAVMGSKRLKAIAVQGNQKIPIMREEPFKTLRRKMNIALKDENVSRAFRQYGTSSGVDYMDYLGEVPKYAFTRGAMEGVSKVSGITMAETILKGVSTCDGCVIACGRVVKLEGSEKEKGPEYETIAGFGPNLGITDLPFITRMGDICDRYGMDTISTSNIIGLAFLLFQEGLIDEHDTGGLNLEWGNQEAVEELIHATVQRRGIGELLAKGSKALAEYYGVPGYAAQVKGLEVPYHDPRGGSGSALVYATSTRGACHMTSNYFWVDIFGRDDEELGIKAFKRHDGAIKAENVARHQNWGALSNSLIICLHAMVPVRDLVDFFNFVTGFDYSLGEMMEAGERGWNLKRAINLRLGLKPSDDTLPDILIKPLPDGGSAGYVPPMEEMLDAYYEARQWDANTGKPYPRKLEELGLSEIVQDIWD
jgi:aldehyde:ferredoxin oxidoreductase